MKLSFSLSSKSSSAAAKTPQTFSADPAAAADSSAPRPQYFTVFDPSKPAATSSSSSIVIPPIPNSDFRPAKKMKNLLPTPSSDDPDTLAETQFVLDTSGADAPAGSIPYGLTLRNSKSLPEESSDEPKERDPRLAELRKFQEDINQLPEDRGMEEFEEIPIESFGAAVLAGYGWKEGKGIGRGRKEDVKVVQYKRRQGTQGFGYDPSSHAASKSSDTKKPPPPPFSNDEKIVRVIAGRHMGSKGRVVETSGKRLETSGVVVLKLLESGEEVKVGGEMIAKLGSEEEEKCLRRLKELDIRERDEKKSSDSRRAGNRNRDDERKHSNGSHHSRKSSEKDREQDRWLRSHIRVRIISKDFKGGKWYLKKGEVVDVVGLTTCDISMDGSGELVQGVDQKILETALPKRGGSVLVLYGRHKGVYGSLVERDSEEETGVVRDADSHALINVRLEQIAEYVGDPSYIGY